MQLVTAGGGLVWHSVELVQSAAGAPIPGAAALWVSVACLVVNEAMFHVSIQLPTVHSHLAGERGVGPLVREGKWLMRNTNEV